MVIAGICDCNRNRLRPTGGVIGYERQHRGKPAGLKTYVIIAMASALMMLISKYGFTDVTGAWVRVDPSRMDIIPVASDIMVLKMTEGKLNIEVKNRGES